MFHPAYLDTLDEGQLTQLYEDCHCESKRLRRRGDWGLARWWETGAAEACNAIGRLYMSNAEPSFVREQLELPSMPSRVSPELRA